MQGFLTALVGAGAAILLAGTASAEPLPVAATDFALKAALPRGAAMDMAHSGGRVRLLISGGDVPTPTLGIIDVKRGKMLVMLPNIPKAAVETDIPPAYRTAIPEGEGERVGTGEVAGEACDVWRIEKTQITEGVAFACITADGIPLKTEIESKGKRTLVYEVESLSRAPQDPAQFQLPRGTQTLKIPAGAGALIPALGGLGLKY
ncbi:hypothetical protein [Aquabacter spiritensis]|uniref:DUF4412 domain-containing protein n=1 Tax=Aquabacter spiritensis TaxID=933073 RepID=A0A4R3M6N4_9HYPH|nr:hypothetical protein [Aquabacter spiritensis]TCT08263.1 hypothetical protein EDC64_101786 [Aquabacter spiritensis]